MISRLFGLMIFTATVLMAVYGQNIFGHDHIQQLSDDWIEQSTKGENTISKDAHSFMMSVRQTMDMG